MTRIRVLIYKDGTDMVLDDFEVEDHDPTHGPYIVAGLIRESIPDELDVKDMEPR